MSVHKRLADPWEQDRQQAALELELRGQPEHFAMSHLASVQHVAVACMMLFNKVSSAWRSQA